MLPVGKSASRAEFGDFQTPTALAKDVCGTLFARGLAPATIVEPTCGEGSFLFAALEQFPTASRALALDINPAYVARVREKLVSRPRITQVRVVQADFFKTDWNSIFRTLEDPILVIGNPPWVTNSDLGALGSSNLPQKANCQDLSGVEAITGKSNFDISEWMISRILESLDGRPATFAMLCKTAVARKVLWHAWKSGIQISRAETFSIDASQHFSATVDACLLLCDLAPGGHCKECAVYPSLCVDAPDRVFGFREHALIADVASYDRWKHLRGQERYKWRSGVKHDCSNVVEFRLEGHRLRNGLGEVVKLEDTCLYPMLKSSDLANGDPAKEDRWMLVTQRTLGEETSYLRGRAPMTWDYLKRHEADFARRASSVYKGRPPFSIFGVGEYTFAPWKVATSAFYKRLDFKVVGPVRGKPVVFDDTCYFLPCRTDDEAYYLASLLNSAPSKQFFSSFIFWDAKRPITIELLRKLDLLLLSRELGCEGTLLAFLRDQNFHQSAPASRNLPLFAS